jgi:hypothetical protein
MWVCEWDGRHIWHISFVGLSTLMIQIRLCRTFFATLRLLCCVECVLFYFLCFIMKLFVTRRSRSSGIVLPAARCVRPCQHVEASNNLSITLLPIRNVLILNRENWSDCVNIFVHVVFVLIFIVHFLLWLALTSFYDRCTTGYLGFPPCYSWHLAGLCSVSGCPATDYPSSRSWELWLDLRL